MKDTDIKPARVLDCTGPFCPMPLLKTKTELDTMKPGEILDAEVCMPEITKSVKIYSMSTCPYCSMAKDYLKENNIQFEDIDVGNDPKAADEMIQKSGQMGVPVIDIGGKIIIGFNKEAIAQELGINK